MSRIPKNLSPCLYQFLIVRVMNQYKWGFITKEQAIEHAMYLAVLRERAKYMILPGREAYEGRQGYKYWRVPEYDSRRMD